MSLFPLLHQFVLTVLEPISTRSGKLVNEIASFKCLASIVADYQAIKRCKLGQVTESLLNHLALLQKNHLVMFQIAYRPSEIKPKDHMSLHLPEQIRRHGMLLDCWVCERKHRRAKAFAEGTDNLRTFESTVIAKATS